MHKHAKLATLGESDEFSEPNLRLKNTATSALQKFTMASGDIAASSSTKKRLETMQMQSQEYNKYVMLNQN